MEHNIFFIVNPNSRSGKSKKIWESRILPEVKYLFPQAQWAYTKGSGDASLMAFEAKKLGFDTVVAVGGDGTINEVVNGLLDNCLIQNQQLSNELKNKFVSLNNESIEGTALACLPLGTGCDFIKTLQIPNHFRNALNVIQSGQKILCDVGRIEFENVNKMEQNPLFRYFINVAGCGASGEAIQRINKSKKIFGRRGAFLISAVQTLLKNRSFPIKISYDNEEFTSLNLRVLFVCNGQFCGGGMHIATNASLQNGKFSVIQVKKMNNIRTILLLKRLYSGDFSGLEKDILVREAQSIRILDDSPLKIPAESDGENPGYLPASFTILPKTLSVYAQGYV
ncbi:diacylglycerol/lipid kinase family protein [Silvanigrella aquatica]|uniref:DAGKc domain-containing protein n=1 Tax=Silvanigrella aquatica TaxID=1915309 RepID=A0A1L4CZF7_9BACT|nr:diacylglycerol kinase family protein [Silvanigrella aquatica]APJ03331.1 hypothetical protein AXG55_05195 [Silvanigrella aquatica]